MGETIIWARAVPFREALPSREATDPRGPPMSRGHRSARPLGHFHHAHARGRRRLRGRQWRPMREAEEGPSAHHLLRRPTPRDLTRMGPKPLLNATASTGAKDPLFHTSKSLCLEDLVRVE